MRLSNGDWNDGAVIGFVPRQQHEEVRRHAESVLNAAFAAFALDLYAQMLGYSGQPEKCGGVQAFAAGQRQAVRAQWTGRWFKRGWLSETLGWIGEDRLWLEPQPWAIIGGSATPDQTAVLMKSIHELVRQPSPIGAMLYSQAVSQMSSPAGELENGGVWPSINGTLIWALALHDPELAWDEWQKNSLARHAEMYPEVWYGIWSGPDVYNSSLSKRPGQTFYDEKAITGEVTTSAIGPAINWTDFPVMNMHPHAWPLYSAAKLMGIQFTPEGVELSPALPKPEYRFESPLLGLDRSPDGYSGWYAPSQPGKWQVTLTLPPPERARFVYLEVNGQAQPLHTNAVGAFYWTGESSPDRPLRWSLGRGEAIKCVFSTARRRKKRNKGLNRGQGVFGELATRKLPSKSLPRPDFGGGGRGMGIV